MTENAKKDKEKDKNRIWDRKDLIIQDNNN